MIKSIDHLNIVVTNLEASSAFFKALGFEETIASDLDPAFLEKVTGIADAKASFVGMKHPGSTLVVELLHYESPVAEVDPAITQANRVGFRHVAFAVSDIEDTVQKLKGLGFEFLTPVRTWEKTGKKLVYFKGPDGILLELAEYPRA